MIPLATFIRYWMHLALVFFLGPIAASAESVQTDLQQDGLHGPVRYVRIQSALPGKNSIRRPLKTVHYDRKGYRAELTLYRHNGFINSHTVFQYDSNCNKIEEKLFDGAARLLSKKTWQYDRLGRRTQDGLFAGNGQPVYQTFWRYAPDGNVLEERLVSPSRPVENKSIRFDYDRLGRRRSEIRFDHGNIPYQKRIFYYGKNHRLIREALFKLGKTPSGETKTGIIENRLYDKHGHLKETTEFLPNGRFWKQWRYLYDKKGHRTQEIFYLKPGEVESRWVYLIDPNNDHLLEERYKKRGETVFIRKSLYDREKSKSTSSQSENKQTERFLYNLRLDKQGNWVEKTAKKLETNQTEPEIIRTYYRIIEYY